MSIVEMFAPSPLVMSHRTIKFGGLTVCEPIMVRGVELTAAVVVLD